MCFPLMNVCVSVFSLNECVRVDIAGSFFGMCVCGMYDSGLYFAFLCPAAAALRLVVGAVPIRLVGFWSNSL